MRGGRGTIGYLFTDIDASTERWERQPRAMEKAVAHHDAILDALIAQYGGIVRDRAGDGVFASFEDGDPLGCALAIQLAMQGEDWRDVADLPLRVGVHAGPGDAADSADQVSINRAARITDSGWGGQIVISAEAAAAFETPTHARLEDLGFCRLRGIELPLRLYSLVHDDLARIEFPPLRALAALSQPLADMDAPFFGREREIQLIRDLLAASEPMLVTVVGPGGNGKTRLAARLAAEFSEQCPVWFVRLEGVSNSAEAAAAIARELRFPFYGTPAHADQLAQYLRDKKGLLVLDNAEGLGDTHLLARLSSECQQLQILTTSRRPLGLAGEALVTLGGFEAAGAEALRASPAYQLFAHHARATLPNFELADSEFEAFRELCAILDGSPLAILLAGQWRHLLPIGGIVARVRKTLDFLRATEAGGPERHRSLRAMFEGTWTALSADERQALARLSVFCAGFDADAAETVAPIDLLTLLALQGRGLVEQRQQHRFILHPLIHEYAAEKLESTSGEALEVRRRHALYFLHCACTAFGETALRGQRAVLDWIEQEIANLLEAWRFACQFESETARDAAEALFYGLALRARYGEAATLFAGGVHPYHLALLANCKIQQGDLEGAKRDARAALEDASADELTRAHALHALGLVAHAKGEIGSALALYESGLAIRRGLGDLWGCYFSLASLAVLHLVPGELEAARACIREGYQLCLKLGNDSGMMIIQFLAGEVAMQEGRTEDAADNYNESLKIEEALHHPQHRARILISLGALHASRGAYGEALECHQQALNLALELGDRHRAATAMLETGVDFRMAQQLESAKLRLVQATRIALDLRAGSVLARCLFELARVEAAMGDNARAWNLAMIVANAELGSLRAAYDAFVGTLPKQPSPDAKVTPEAAARQIIEEAELAPLRLERR